MDGDPKVLEIARSKAGKAGVSLNLDLDMAYQLPYQDNSFDRVLSSLVFHHLESDDKRQAMREVYRVLRPGGEFYLLDLGKPHKVYGQVLSIWDRWMEGWQVNHKRVERIWRQEEGLKVPQKQPKRGRLWLNDGSCLRGVPAHLRSDKGPEFIADRLRQWLG